MIYISVGFVVVAGAIIGGLAGNLVEDGKYREILIATGPETIFDENKVDKLFNKIKEIRNRAVA